MLQDKLHVFCCPFFCTFRWDERVHLRTNVRRNVMLTQLKLGQLANAQVPKFSHLKKLIYDKLTQFDVTWLI